jgi:hypothetical protein
VESFSTPGSASTAACIDVLRCAEPANTIPQPVNVNTCALKVPLERTHHVPCRVGPPRSAECGTHRAHTIAAQHLPPGLWRDSERRAERTGCAKHSREKGERVTFLRKMGGRVPEGASERRKRASEGGGVVTMGTSSRKRSELPHLPAAEAEDNLRVGVDAAALRASFSWRRWSMASRKPSHSTLVEMPHRRYLEHERVRSRWRVNAREHVEDGRDWVANKL